jgi:hypothetical protein
MGEFLSFTESGDKAVGKIVAELGFDVRWIFVFGEVVGEGVNEPGEFGLEGIKDGGHCDL